MISDHGHSLGEHGLIGKLPHAQYPELMDIPLMIRHPSGERAGTSLESWAYDSDLLPTALHLLGIQEPLPVDGHDLWQVGNDVSGERDFVTSFLQDYFRIQDDRYLYIGKSDGSEPQLYVLKDDPKLENNIAPDASEIVEALRTKLLDDAGGKLPDFDENSLRKIGPWYELV